jgi:hypothetical protein
MSPARAAVICSGAGLLRFARQAPADHLIRTIRSGALAPNCRRDPL